MLGTLFKDERCQSLVCFSVLEKMHLDRLIEERNLAVFQTLLQPHHLATTADGAFMLLYFSKREKYPFFFEENKIFFFRSEKKYFTKN